MKRLLFALILLHSLWILFIANIVFINAQGNGPFLQPSLYPGQLVYPWGSQGFITNYISQNTATNQLWSTSQFFSPSGVYSSLDFSSPFSSSFSLNFPSVHSLDFIHYNSTFQSNQSSVLSSILSRTSLNTIAPFTNLSLSNYYPQGIGASYYMNLFTMNDAYLRNPLVPLFFSIRLSAIPSFSLPAYNNFTLKSPYQAKNSSYKGQIHCHTTNSDGADSPADLVTAYKNAGYDFIIVTDHDTVTTNPSVSGIRFIQGCEETALTGHIGRLSCSKQTPDLDAQTILNTIRAEGGISILNHPWGSADYQNDWTIQEIERLYGYDAIEIFNGSQQDREHNAEMHWDAALSRGVFVQGVATDDCHNRAGSGFNEGWIVVFANTNSEADIIQGIRSGNFYSSSGPDITLSVSSSTITATTEISSAIIFIGNNGTILQRNPATTSASYTVKESERYIRVKVTRDSDKECAWSNPVIIEKW